MNLEIAVKKNVFFVHNRDFESNKNRRNSKGVNKKDIVKYDRVFRGFDRSLNDGRNVDFLSVNKVYKPKSDTMRLTVEEISRRVTASKMIEHVETFTFVNLTPSPVDVRFEIGKDYDHGPITLIESSIESTHEGEAIWKITVPGHSEKILTTTTHVLE